MNMSEPTIQYSLIVETNKYAGNFHRSLVTYAFGILDESNYESKKMLSLFDKETTKEEKELLEMETVDSRPTEEYGFCTNFICGWPRNNVEIYLSKDFIKCPEFKETMDIVIKRIYAFSKVWKEDGFEISNIKLVQFTKSTKDVSSKLGIKDKGLPV